MKLNKLYIKSFRGATQPITVDFDPSKNITMLFAENGNGKSTIADALICLCTDRMGSLDDKSSVDKAFYKSLGAKDGETKIAINTNEGNFVASLLFSGKSFKKNPLAGQPSLKFLRRIHIINLINSQASDRYAALKDYLDVSNIYNSEEALRKLFRDTERDHDTATKVFTNAMSVLSKCWKDEGSPDISVLAWAERQTAMDISKEETNYKITFELLNQWLAISHKSTEIDSYKLSVKISNENKNALIEFLGKIVLSNTTNSPTLLSLLEHARNFISGNNLLDKCPICDNDIVQEEIVASLDNQIKSMSALQEAIKKAEDANKTYEKNRAILNTGLSGLSVLLIKYKNSISKYVQAVPDIAPFVDGIGTDDVTNYKLYVANFKSLAKLYERIEKSAGIQKKAIEQHTFIKTQYNSILQNNELIKRLQTLKTATERALEIVATTRKDFYDNELLSISSEVERMYQKIHPLEGLGGIKLFLNPKYKNSLELSANFHSEQDVTPQSVYSESHLDTLAICIFLALAKKYSDNRTILILDDVVMSVDENHLDRFIDLLHDESDKFAHTLITTHYRPWRDRYRNNRAPASNVHFVELRNWSMQNGIRVFNGKNALDELKNMLKNEEAFDRANISSSSGRILENILDFITLKFSSRMPRKLRNDYQLGELLDGLSKTLLKVMKVEHYAKDEEGKYTMFLKEVEIKPTIDKLKDLRAIRNQVGAHYNFDGSLVNDHDVQIFGKLTVEFADLLICPDCGSLPDRNKNGSCWETRTGSIKLYPFVEP